MPDYMNRMPWAWQRFQKRVPVPPYCAAQGLERENGFVFFTNHGSRKASKIAANPNVGLLFYWEPLHRQIRIEGTAQKVSTMESLKYFVTRPRGSQSGAWCSAQSSTISSREILHAKLAEIKQKVQGGEVPLPSFWGGYRVIPSRFEFWQAGDDRLLQRSDES